MKSKFLVFAALSFFTLNCYSQSFHIGIKAGANLGKISGQSFKDEFSLGYHAGAFATIGLGSKFAIQPEVLFSQINNDTTTNFNDVFKPKNTNHIQLKFLTIPILLNYNLTKFLAIQAGPQFGILLNENDNLLQNGKNAFNSGNFSLVGGVQLKVLKFRIYGRYIGGLTDLQNIKRDATWKATSVQLGIGFSIL